MSCFTTDHTGHIIQSNGTAALNLPYLVSCFSNVATTSFKTTSYKVAIQQLCINPPCVVLQQFFTTFKSTAFEATIQQQCISPAGVVLQQFFTSFKAALFGVTIQQHWSHFHLVSYFSSVVTITSIQDPSQHHSKRQYSSSETSLSCAVIQQCGHHII